MQKLGHRRNLKMVAIDTLLPEEILEKIICSYCKKYLSVGQTKVYPSGKISCGRCTPAEEHLGCTSFYERVAPYLVFPCINNRNGCTKQLKYNQVAHEKACTKVTSHCPICPGTSEYTLAQLENHFEVVHPRNVMDTFEYDLKINFFDKTDKHFLVRKPSLMLMFIKYDGQWLYLNLSVQYKYVCAKFEQTVTNSGESKLCSFLGQNEDFFKYFLPKSLDCFAKILLQDEGSKFTISIEFVPYSCGIAGKVKTMSLPSYEPKFWIGEDMERDLQAKYGRIRRVDVKCFTFSSCKTKIITVNKPKISIPVRCGCCENFFWEVPCIKFFQCDHFIICDKCYQSGYTNCKIDRAELEEGRSLPNFIKLRIYCRYDCGDIFNIEQIVDHENTWHRNLLSRLPVSSITFGKLCFGSAFDKISIVSGTTASSFDLRKYQSAYFVTKDDRKCIFHYKDVLGKMWFSVEHEYDKKKCVAIIRIKCRDGTVRDEENSFFRNSCNSDKYFVNNRLIFWIILKEIK